MERRKGRGHTLRPFSFFLIHPIAWKGNSPNFACTEFYEVRLRASVIRLATLLYLSALEVIRQPLFRCLTLTLLAS